jgi:hypothetical protein
MPSGSQFVDSLRTASTTGGQNGALPITIGWPPDSLRSSALRTSARPSHRLLNDASGCAVRALHSG